MNYKEYCELYRNILALTMDKEAAIAIMQEIGKDTRTPQRDNLPYQNIPKKVLKGEITEGQKSLLRKLKIPITEGMSKQEASELIDSRLKKAKP